ncbi:WxL protein peptidoglycan domain-containing protein [Microbacterium ulmi]|uniref:DUF916 domain-containing protein n=1 Tax=Microbacterium ulmi TaxID=179095 RepID=A0A7Y2M039_9MICO|nr:DUF916 domain-containing protein [Microbacterium ulmi]NII69613.1 hypothetical protein [Microbacterium ulmi]NNH03499.1 DUF916 domain-containing protein [Microbacterium ulmi]
MRLRVRPARLLAGLTAVLLASATPALASPASADTPPALGWTLETVDNDNGAGRRNFVYTVDAGATIHDALRVTNVGASPLDLAVYAADAFTTPTGQIDLQAGTTPPVDAGLWTTVGTTLLTLAPGQQAQVDFTIAVPTDAPPGDHAAGIVTSHVSGEGDVLAVDRRLATRVTVRVNGELAPSAQIQDFTASYAPSWNPFEPGVARIDYRLTNTGNTLVTASDVVDAAGPFGLFGRASPATALPEVIPGSTIDVHRELALPPLGWITGAISVSPEAVGLGAQLLEPTIHEFGVLAMPWTLLVVLAAVLVVAAIAILLVRRRSVDAVAATHESPAGAA